MSENIKEIAAKGLIWSFIESFSVKLIQFVITVIMARMLTPSDYGLIGMLSIFMSISQVFIDGGFSSALIQKKDRSDEDLSTVFFINIFFSIIIYIILFLCAPFIATFYNQPLLSPIIKVYCCTLVIYSLVGVTKTILTIDLDFKTQSKISVLSSVLSGLTGIYLAWSGLGVWALVIQSVAMAILNVLFSYLLAKWRPKLLFSTHSMKSLFSFGSKLLFAQIIGAAYQNMYNLVIGKNFTSDSLGYYSRAESFTNLTSYTLSSIFTRVSFPLLSKTQTDNGQLLSIYNKYISIAAFVMFPISMTLCGCAKPIIITLLTDRWTDAITILQILSISTLWTGITAINLNLLNVKGRSDLVLRLEIIKKTIAFTILFVSLIFNNLIIICWGLVFYSIIALYLNTYYTNQILNYGFIAQLKTMFPYLLLSVLIMIEGLIVAYIINNNYLALFVSLFICVTTYIGLSALTKLYAFEECKSYLLKLINK